MEKFIKNIQEVFTTEEKNESGEFAANIILMGILVVTAVVVGGWVASGLINQGANNTECLNKVNISSTSLDNNCDDVDNAKDNDFKDSESYNKRFGG